MDIIEMAKEFSGKSKLPLAIAQHTVHHIAVMRASYLLHPMQHREQEDLNHGVR
jgi:hypothetical protein